MQHVDFLDLDVQWWCWWCTYSVGPTSFGEPRQLGYTASLATYWRWVKNTNIRQCSLQSYTSLQSIPDALKARCGWWCKVLLEWQSCLFLDQSVRCTEVSMWGAKVHLGGSSLCRATSFYGRSSGHDVTRGCKVVRSPASVQCISPLKENADIGVRGGGGHQIMMWCINLPGWDLRMLRYIPTLQSISIHSQSQLWVFKGSVIKVFFLSDVKYPFSRSSCRYIFILYTLIYIFQ